LHPSIEVDSVSNDQGISKGTDMIRKNRLFKKIACYFTLVSIIAVLSPIAFAVVSQTPLFLVSPQKPNVAILLDNSGSMWDMMYHPNFPTDINTQKTKPWYNETFAASDDYILQKGNYGDNHWYLVPLDSHNNTVTLDSSRTLDLTLSGGRKICLPLSSDPNDTQTRYNGAYLSWMFYDQSPSPNSTQSAVNAIQTITKYQKTRIRAAKDAIESLINSTYDATTGTYPYRWGAFTYTYNPNDSSPPSLGNCSDNPTDVANLLTNVENVQPSMNTPLGNSLLALWNYYKGSNTPITTSCQKNFVIVMTDGYPYIPNQGGSSNYYDKYGSDAKSASSSDADYWYNPDFPTNNWYRSKAQIVTQRMHTEGANSTSIDTFVVGLAFGDSDANNPALLLNMMAQNGNTGTAYAAGNANQLADALNTILISIMQRSVSASSVAVNTFQVSDSTRIYRAKFDPAYWIGYLEAFKYTTTNNGTQVDTSSPVWEAGARLNNRDATTRAIYTAGKESGTNTVYHRYDYTTTNATVLKTPQFMNFSTNTTKTTKTQTLISYIRGEAYGSTNPAGYRKRASRLGDMIYSAPVFLGAPTGDYADFNGPSAGAYTDSSYNAFKTNTTINNRTQLIIVGANDGMLHAFTSATGDEQWAFIPNSLLSKLKFLRNNYYSHQNYVDGSPTIADAYIKTKDANGNSASSADWHTILVCGLREGGQSYFAMDVTSPTNPVPLWEISPSSPDQNNKANGLGYTFGNPLILKLKDSSATNKTRWVAVFSNGYQGTTANKSATLIIVDLATGSIIKEIVVDSNTNVAGGYQNGLSSPRAVDTDGDGFTDYIYAGDLRGNLWKFTMGDGSANWVVSYGGATPQPLFKAYDTNNKIQPITTEPAVLSAGDHQIVAFGTGKYFENTDMQSTDVQQSFYTVYDYNIPAASFTSSYTRNDLGANTISSTITDTNNGDTSIYRTMSAGNFIIGKDASSKKGWYIDLTNPGERVIADPIIRKYQSTDQTVTSYRVIFTTFTPNLGQCVYGGTSWLMELDLYTGGAVIAFDTNGDHKVDSGDTQVGGLYLGEGVASTPTVLHDTNDPNSEHKLISKSDAVILNVDEYGYIPGTGIRTFRILSWRQVL